MQPISTTSGRIASPRCRSAALIADPRGSRGSSELADPWSIRVKPLPMSMWSRLPPSWYCVLAKSAADCGVGGFSW